MNLLIQLKQTTSVILIAPVLACLVFSPSMQALLPPPAPDGGYPNANTAEGNGALLHLTSGTQNTATGYFALYGDETGSYNTATGALALSHTTTGSSNTAIGDAALDINVNGNNNTAVGASALEANTASGNTGVGRNALIGNTSGHNNTALGGSAAVSITTGSNNTALGNGAGSGATTGNGNIYVGAGVAGVAGESNHTYICNIPATTVNGTGTDTVTVNLTTGLLGHLSSSRRYKEDIKPMDTASEAVFSLKPVTYRYKKEIDPSQSPAFGLIAEEVSQVNPDLVARNSQGQPESVHYEMVNAMLLNEFLKQHKAFIDGQHNVEKLQATVVRQQKQIEALTAGLQRVSAQLELSKPAPRTVLNNQ